MEVQNGSQEVLGIIEVNQLEKIELFLSQQSAGNEDWEPFFARQMGEEREGESPQRVWGVRAEPSGRVRKM